MKTKICSKCKKRKLLKYFYKNKRTKDGLRFECKVCSKQINRNWGLKHVEYRKKYYQNYYANNFKRIKENKQKWQRINTDKLNERRRNKRMKNSKRLNEVHRNWCKNNPEKIKQYNNKISIKLGRNLRSRIWMALKGIAKSAHTLELLGCSILQLIKHLEKQFKKGMTWANYGKWHVDHIKPLSSFDLTKLKQQRLACNYKNLQPLWAAENLRKYKKCVR